jgi:protein-tyrosine phosphatase
MNYANIICSYVSATYKVAKDKTSYWINSENIVEQPKRHYQDIGYIEQYKAYYSPPTYILDNLFLGSAFNAANYAFLKDLDIDIIINITHEISNYYPTDFMYVQYKINDTDKTESDIIPYLEESYKFIKENNKDKKILVHCYMGASRSATIIIYYLMKEHKMTLEEALVLLKSKRYIVNPNCKFIEVLKNKEHEISNKLP